MNNINNPNNPVVLFIPEAGIYPYVRGLAVLGDAVQKNGGSKVSITHCTGQMERCPMMVMNKMPVGASPEKKAALCKICTANVKKVQKQYEFSTIELSGFVDDELLKEIDELINNADDFKKITFRGFPVGKITQYDFILETKTPYSSEISEVQETLYLAYIKNTIIACAIADGICKKYNPSLMLTFNEYAQCQAVHFSANTFNVRRMAMTNPVNFNIDFSKFLIWKSTYEFFFYSHCQEWNSVKDIPIISQSVRECWDDVIFRLFGSGGSHVFSNRKNGDPAFIFNELKLVPKKKTILVYPSSYDERYGKDIIMKVWGEGPHVVDAFSSQIEWLSFLQDYVSKRNDIQIVVRIHPREGSRQYGFDSQHLKSLKAKFLKNTENFIIIWPDDQISSYDLMELADVCLVSWSLMGQEAARLGIPVLSCTGNMFYPDDDFIQVATDPEEYKRKLDSIIEMKFTWQHLIKAVRFYHWRTFIPSLDLGETVPKDFDDHSIWPEAPSSMVGVINDVLHGKQDLIEYNIKKWKESLPEDAIIQETIAMKQGIRQFIDKIFYPPQDYKKTRILVYLANRAVHILAGRNIFTMPKSKPFKDYCLKYSESIEKLNDFIAETKKDSKLRVLVSDGLYAVLIHNGRVFRRMSPVIIRLAKLYHNAV